VNWHVAQDPVSYNQTFLYTHARRGNGVVRMCGSRPILSRQESEERDEDRYLRILRKIKYIGHEHNTYEDLGRCQDLHVHRTTIVEPRKALYTIHYQTQVYRFWEY
jgi:hypothetical protein